MENLLEELFQRWELAFDELKTLPVHKALVKSTRYARSLRYTLKTFERNSFPGGGSMVNDKDELDTNEPYEYGFNADGLPCYVTYRHDFNKINWEGFYTYSDTLVEYVEFCLNSGVPSLLTRIKFNEARKISLQSIVIDGGGSGYSLSKATKEQVINQIKKNYNSLIVTVTHYDYDTAGRIEKASSMHIMPGLGKFTSYDEYNYDNDGGLDTIRTFFEQGTSRLSYCKPTEGMTPEAVADSLAGIMAASIAEALASQDIEEPIALLELSYHYADNYNPILVWQTVHEVEAKLSDRESIFPLDYYNALNIDTLPYEGLFAQLEKLMDDDDDCDLGRSMLMKTAFLLTTNKLFGKVKVSDYFAAYAIDWSIEGHSDEDFEEILLRCGLEASGIETWKQKGIILPGNAV